MSSNPCSVYFCKKIWKRYENKLFAVGLAPYLTLGLVWFLELGCKSLWRHAAPVYMSCFVVIVFLYVSRASIKMSMSVVDKFYCIVDCRCQCWKSNHCQERTYECTFVNMHGWIHSGLKKKLISHCVMRYCSGNCWQVREWWCDDDMLLHDKHDSCF